MTNKKNSGGSSSETGKSGDKEAPSSTANDKDNAAAAAVDKSKRFEGEGVVFKAKLIGSELVMEPRGDKMCQNSITRLKAIIKGTNSHKRRVVLKISFSGVRVYDEKTNEILHDNEVSQISYTASDDSDNRCFGYVCDVPNKAHQFICFKTSGPAMQVMQAMSALFDAVLERKKQREDATSKKSEEEDKISKGKESVTDLIIGDLSADEPAIDQQQVGGRLTGIGASDRGFSFDDGFSDITTQSTPSLNQAMHQQQASIGGAAGNQIRGNQMNRTNSNSLDLIDDSGIMDNNNANEDAMFGALINKQASSASATGAPPIAIPSSQSDHQAQQQHALGAAQFNLQQQQQARRHNSNRSLVYNHSSKSLSDAMLPRQSPGNGNAMGQLAGVGGQTSSSLRNDSYVDRYAVFNDIDNLPSIFESTSLNSLNNSTTNINNTGTNINNNNNNNAPFSVDPLGGASSHFGDANHINSNSSNSISRSGFGQSAAAGFKSSSSNLHMDQFGGRNMLHHQQSMPAPVPQVPQRQQQMFSAGTRLSSSFASGSGFPTNSSHGSSSAAASAHQWFSSSSASMGDVMPGNAGSGASFLQSSGGPVAGLTGVGSNSQLVTNAGSNNASAATHQWLASSTASIKSTNSAANFSNGNNVFRQTNPFDEEFFNLP